MRVFISSTAYDLIDVRAELFEYFKLLGITAILSDNALSDFSVEHNINSIETCLVNVDRSDEVVVILDKRYGPSLKSAGYDDISATHLEYRRALEGEKPIHFFVRDRLEADYSIWKKNKGNPGLKLSWIAEGNGNLSLFDFIGERTKLRKDAKASNWFSLFSTSTDLKAALDGHFAKATTPQRLTEAIYQNRFPLFGVELTHEIPKNRSSGIIFILTITNVSDCTAFNVDIEWKDRDPSANLDPQSMSPGQSTPISFVFVPTAREPRREEKLILRYDTPIGITVTDEYLVRAAVVGDKMRSGSILVSRKFKQSKFLHMKIEDAE